jgi:ABC-type spermidine/putrescine transport system permease subunit II
LGYEAKGTGTQLLPKKISTPIIRPHVMNAHGCNLLLVTTKRCMTQLCMCKVAQPQMQLTTGLCVCTTKTQSAKAEAHAAAAALGQNELT